MQAITELDLIAKLVEQWHLNSHERKALPEGKAKGSLVVNVLQDIVTIKGKYPIDWGLSSGFDGGLVEKLLDGACAVHWMGEVGMCRFELKEKLHYASVREACDAYARRFFNNDIDGVPIDWSA
jgi:hypothetical protein